MFSSEGFLPEPQLRAHAYWMLGVIKFSEGRRPTKFPPEGDLVFLVWQLWSMNGGTSGSKIGSVEVQTGWLTFVVY
ncbi:uncharacterized protein [Apostichopus japonicus]|uniref:uncharacterized protein isoform X6 n=1 Tax=Stichopus japonicus TaxID=307972 RepID=UPI003AB82AA2